MLIRLMEFWFSQNQTYLLVRTKVLSIVLQIHLLV
uniref:Uncharacterized protein n=1 Tax=Dulem virus 42 TaxID=3145760 RepID=A0AAU8B7K3_9CAUD